MTKKKKLDNNKLAEIMYAVQKEYDRATLTYGRFNSAHEGFAVMLEEVDELWDEVKKKTNKRSKTAMRNECIQIAAMALRYITDIC